MQRKAEQTSLDFESADSLQVSIESARFEEMVAAPASSRAFAAIVDVCVPCLGFALFATTFQLATGGVEITFREVPFYAAAAALILVFYRVIWCLGNMDTPGLQAAGLRLRNFDGHRPARKARFQRLAGGLVSLVAAGIGLVWALLDEQRLTWHDYMSGTFPVTRS